MHRTLPAFSATSALLILAPQARAEAPASSGPAAMTPGITQGRVYLTRQSVLDSGPALSYAQTMNAITDQISVLSRLRDWRGTLGGSGPKAQRQWTLASPGGQKLQLAMGAQALPRFQLASMPTSAVGTSVRMGRFAAGTTWRPRELDQLAAQYDGAMTGTAPTALTAPQPAPWAWLSARPLESKAGNLDLLYARRRQDGREDAFSGARGEWNAPLRWKVNGELSQSRRDDDAASAWSLGASGPVRHFWGEATATAQVKEVAPRFTSWDGAAVEPAQNGSLALQQNIAVGQVSGSLLFSVAQTRPLSEVIAQNIALTQEAQSNTDLRWKLTPSVSVITRHTLRNTAQRLGTAPAIAPDATAPEPTADGAPAADAIAPVDAAGDGETAGLVATPVAWQIATEQSADAGLEWKWSRSLAFSATAGQTRAARRLTCDDIAPASGFSPGANIGNRVGLGLQRRTKGGAWSIGVTRELQAAAASVAVAPVDTGQLDGLQLAGERNLGPGLRIKGTYGVTNNYTLAEQLLDSRIARSLEAQWSLDMGRLDFGVRDSYGATVVDPNAAREWTARFNLGSANKGNGLGLAVEYARREQVSQDAQPVWRVGVTYK